MTQKSTLSSINSPLIFKIYQIAKTFIKHAFLLLKVLFALIYNCGQNIGCKPDILTAYRPLTVTLFRPALEPGLLCALAGFPSAFLAVRCLQPDRQSGLVQHIDYAALGEGFFQAAKVGVLLAERCQPLPQSGIVGLDVGSVLALVEQDNGLFLILRQGHTRHPPIQLPDSRSRCAQKPFHSADMLPSLSGD